MAKKETVESLKCWGMLVAWTSTCSSSCSIAQVVPILLCGSELWVCFDCPNVEKVHMYACKRILDIFSQSPNHMVYGDLGRHHLSVLASARCVKYWLRLNKLLNSRYVEMAYNLLKSKAEEGKENWASAV